jgi:ABC-type transport system involved in multi-copper enzyme maturation permease subunit
MRKQTVLTVLSKPVGRFEFILGKYLGILAGLLITGYLTVIVLMMTVRVGVPSTVRTHLDMAAILGMAIAFALAMGGAVVLNYFFDRPFSSMAILLGLVTFTAAFWVVGLVPPVEESLVDLPFHYDWTMALAGGLVVLSTSVLASVAVAASTRLNPLMTLGICVTFFVAGVAGHDIVDRSGIPSFAADLACGLIFNLQSFWMADVLWAEREIPWQYVGRAATYALAYQGAVLFVALSLFHDREVAR